MEKIENLSGTEVVLSNENRSLKEKIADLQGDLALLKMENNKLKQRLASVAQGLKFISDTSKYYGGIINE